MRIKHNITTKIYVNILNISNKAETEFSLREFIIMLC